ncbi:hypothetical protein PLANPX_2470 [Lacipirellula parvula]|uniref:Uncharacterized protein n=1 Tax=Lacipirellula parvula TaxID=2650471 RepID=A0A5K7X8K0_9BACT|nr:hypothetical protein PLANPX_2470 [Lacipirellula parvula]
MHLWETLARHARPFSQKIERLPGRLPDGDRAFSYRPSNCTAPFGSDSTTRPHG